MMNETVRICWSGLTGRTGCEAILQAKTVADIEIVAGISRFNHDGTGLKIDEVESCADGLYTTRSIDFSGVGKWYRYDDIASPLEELESNFNCLVDFSDKSVFDQVLDLAVRTHVPLISGTSGLTKYQLARLDDATRHIPIFHGGNFRFKVKEFIDEAVEFARACGGDFTLFENFYEGKSLPSETSKIIQRKINETAKATVTVHSATTYGKDLICNWQLLRRDKYSNNGYLAEGPRCHVIGFDELAHDVLEIAKVMITKPVKPGPYDLNEIWDELPH